MKKLIALLLCWPVWVGAASESLYLNCDCAEDGNGRAENCAASAGAEGAWNAPASVLWAATGTVGQVDAEDVLYTTGTCYDRFAVGASGTAAFPIYIVADNWVLDSSVSLNDGGTFDGNLYVTSTSATINESNNSYWGQEESVVARINETNYTTVGAWETAISGADDQGQDPLFIGGPNPTTPAGFKLSPSSPLIGAGTCIYTTGCVPYDYGGRRARVPP